MSEDKMRDVVDMILSEDDTDFEKIEETILLENDEERILRQMGDSTYMNYLMKFEEYLDDHDIYLFDGWEDAKILGKPKVDKFWTEFMVLVSPDTDLRGAMRLKNDKEGQNKVMTKELTDNQGTIVKFKILKRYLDAIEARNKERAEQLSDEQLESIS